MKHSRDNSDNKNARGYLAGSQFPSPRHAEAHALHERSRDDSGRDDGESPGLYRQVLGTLQTTWFWSCGSVRAVSV